MIDKKKIIKGLECCSQTATLEKPFICKECPYFSEGGPCDRIQFARDILALLKWQGWIPCDERLPTEADGTVLICMPDIEPYN